MGDLFKGNYQPPPPEQATGEQLGALVRYLPQLSQAYSNQILPTEQAQLAAQQQIAPQQQALDTSLYSTYGPQIAKVSSDIAAANAMRGAQSDAATLAGPGQDVARAGLAAQQIADPEYYATRALAGQRTNDLLNSININGLSGSERAEVERSLNQQAQQGGSPDISSGIKTVQNAATFGSALQNKRNALGQAISTATQFLPSAKSGVDVFQQVTGRAGMPNNTNAAQATSAQPVGATANNMTSQLFGHVGDIQAQNYDINAARKPVTQFVNEAYKSAMSGAGGSGGCCFIFLESYNGSLPVYVRKCRDYYYEKEPSVSLGYRRMARIIVPLMRYSNIFRSAVNRFMVTPLTKHSEFIFGKSNTSYRSYKRFWFTIWKFIGRI